MRQHGVHVADVAIVPQHRLSRQAAVVADVPLQIADPQHQLRDVAGPRVDLQPQKLVRVHLVTVQPGKGLLAAEIQEGFDHVALQPLHEFERDIEEVAGAAGRVKHVGVVELLMEELHGGDGLLAAGFTHQALGCGEDLLPLAAQGLDDGGDDEALHIGAGRVMRAEARALLRIERLFEKRAEDRRVHLAPVLPGGFAQFADLFLLQRIGGRITEELAVELLHAVLHGGGIVATVHRLPQHFKLGREDVGLVPRAVQEAGEGVLGQQLHILGEHGEDAAHEEGGHMLRRQLALLHALRHGGKALRNCAGGLDGAAGGIERVRIIPDGAEHGLHFGLCQIIEVDAEGLAVRELGVVAALAGEIGVEFEAVADIADDDEGRPLMIGRQVAGIVFRLLAGVVHQHVPGAGGFAAALVFHLRHEIILVWKFAALAPGAGLLRFQHEGAALVEVDEVAALVALHVELELVVAIHWLLEAESLAEVDEELLRLRTLAAASIAPVRDEFADRVRRHGLTLRCGDCNRKLYIDFRKQEAGPRLSPG